MSNSFPMISEALIEAASRFADLRHRIHAHPELGAEVPQTAELAIGLLRQWGL
jgi:hippurate hydrolase